LRKLRPSLPLDNWAGVALLPNSEEVSGMNEEVTVLDLMNYAASHYIPVSGIAIQALMQGAGPNTPVHIDEESLEKIREWKRRERRLINRFKRWLRWHYHRRKAGL